MTKEAIRQTLREKLKDCSKETLIDIIADVCAIYVEARVFSGISNTQRVNQYMKDILTNVQEVDDSLIQRVNVNFRKL